MNEDKNLKSLDEMIADLDGAKAGGRSDNGYGLLTEHLQAARRNLLGSRRIEFGLALEQAKESIGCISNKDDRAKAQKTLSGMIELANAHAS
jgi:hypothetical protein